MDDPIVTGLHLGDCFEVMKRIPDGSVDMVLCDLPYGTTQNKWDSILPLDRLWAEYWRVCKPNAAVVLTAQPPFDKVLGVSCLKYLQYEWIWHKSRRTGHLNAQKQPMREHENVLVFYRSVPTYNPQGLRSFQKMKRQSAEISNNYREISPKDYFQENTNFPSSVLQFESQGSTVHPTQKPVNLFDYLIRTYTNENETILDNTAGSGTTAVAAIGAKRNFICIERDKEYFEIAKKRIEDRQNIVELF